MQCDTILDNDISPPILENVNLHYNDVIMSTMASQVTSLTIVHSTFYSGAYQRKHQRSASLAFVRGIHRWPVNSPHKGPVTCYLLLLKLCLSNVISDSKYTFQFNTRTEPSFSDCLFHSASDSMNVMYSYIALHDMIYSTMVKCLILVQKAI